MKTQKIKSLLEVYVCQHDDCAELGSKELASKLKKWTKERPDKEIKVYRSGCLGQCSEGIALACYPQKDFLLKVQESDVKEIKQDLEAALLKIKGE